MHPRYRRFLAEAENDLQVYADGDNPGDGKPAIEANGVEVPAGANATVAAEARMTRPMLAVACSTA